MKQSCLAGGKPLRADSRQIKASQSCRSLLPAGRLASHCIPRPSLPALSPREARRQARLLSVCAASGGFGGQYSKNAPLTAWSPIRSVISLSKFFLITGSATTSAWFAHPYLLNLAAHVLHLDFKDSVTAFQTSFFSFLSLVFAIYSGNTMAFLYDRQKEMVKQLYSETMALEELLEEAVNTLGPDARDILLQIRQYIDEEIYHPENQSPPLGEGCVISAIRGKARNYRRAGTDVGEILQASQRLAHAQSERQATACRLLPPVHWALLYTIGLLFVSTFILFETGGSFSNEGRHILFTVLVGVMSFVLCALRDLADPAEGVYNATALLGDRLAFLISMLDKYQKLPSRASAPGPSMVAGMPVPADMMAASEIENSGRLTGMLSKLVSDTSSAEPSSSENGNGKGRTDRSLVMSEVETRGEDTQELVSASMLASQRLPEGAAISKDVAGRGMSDIIKVPLLLRGPTFRLGSKDTPPAPHSGRAPPTPIHGYPKPVNGAINGVTGRPYNLPVTAAVTYRFAPGQGGHKQRHPIVHAHHSGTVASHGTVQHFPVQNRAPLSELAVRKLTHAVAAGDDWQAVAAQRAGSDKAPQDPLVLL